MRIGTIKVDHVRGFRPGAAASEGLGGEAPMSSSASGCGIYCMAASPAVARAIFNGAYLSDIRPILSTVGVPTLVLHRAGNRKPVGRLLRAI